MRVKTAPCSRSQPTQSSCYASEFISPIAVSKHSVSLTNSNADTSIRGIGNKQRGAGTWLLALFVVAILVTAIVAALFGHKLGYQSGYYSIQAETKQASVNSEEATKELKDLRISHKVLSNQANTAKQELAISLANLEALKRSQQALKVDNRQTSQLNDLYATVISEQGGMELQILGAKIEPLSENAFEYGFDVGMLSEDGRAKSLKATLTLQNSDKFIEVPLETTHFAIAGIVRIRGRFMMPAGFKPLQVKLNLEADDQKVEQLYNWKLGGMVDNIPLSLSDLPEVDQNPITTGKSKKPIS